MTGPSRLQIAREQMRSLERPLVQALVLRARYRRNVSPSPAADELEEDYHAGILPALCDPGHDGEGDVTAELDRRILDILRRRLQMGESVADAKTGMDPDRYAALVRSGDRDGLLEALTDPAVERDVVERVRTIAAAEAGPAVAERAARVFLDWVIPRTKEAEADHLLSRGDP